MTAVPWDLYAQICILIVLLAICISEVSTSIIMARNVARAAASSIVTTNKEKNRVTQE